MAASARIFPATFAPSPPMLSIRISKNPRSFFNGSFTALPIWLISLSPSGKKLVRTVAYSSRRPFIAFPTETSSEYSRSAPIGSPYAMRVTRAPRGFRTPPR